MKKLPIVILLTAAGITGVAFAQTSSSMTNGSASTEVGRDMGSYGKTSGAYGSKVSPGYGTTTDGASGTTGYGTSSGMSTTDGASGTTGYGTTTTPSATDAYGTTSTTTTTTKKGRVVTSPTGGVNGTTSGTEVGKDLDSYGKTSGATGSKVSPSYGSKRAPMGTGGNYSGTQSGRMGTNGGTSTMPGTYGTTGAPSAGSITWTCPPGYTLSTATRDGSPLCYPSSGPVPGVSR